MKSNRKSGRRHHGGFILNRQTGEGHLSIQNHPVAPPPGSKSGYHGPGRSKGYKKTMVNQFPPGFTPTFVKMHGKRGPLIASSVATQLLSDVRHKQELVMKMASAASKARKMWNTKK